MINLKKLFLSDNKIKKVKGLETLHNLETLDLSRNKISKISGLEALMNIKDLWLFGNKIDQTLIEELGGLDSGGCALEPLKFVEYCLVNL